MNWLPFTVLLWFCSGLEYGFDAFQLGKLEDAGASPSFLMILIVFICLWATPGAAIAASMLCGLALDLMTQHASPGGLGVVILGPHALGALLGASLVLNLRSLVLKRTLWTIGLLVFLCTLVAQVVVVSALALRSTYDIIEFSHPRGALGQGVLTAALSGLLALVVGPLLGLVRPFCGFPATSRRAFSMD